MCNRRKDGGNLKQCHCGAWIKVLSICDRCGRHNGVGHKITPEARALMEEAQKGFQKIGKR